MLKRAEIVLSERVIVRGESFKAAHAVDNLDAVIVRQDHNPLGQNDTASLKGLPRQVIERGYCA
jgi:hypothetical protein